MQSGWAPKHTAYCVMASEAGAGTKNNRSKSTSEKHRKARSLDTQAAHYHGPQPSKIDIFECIVSFGCGKDCGLGSCMHLRGEGDCSMLILACRLPALTDHNAR
jgi:hypothetical protein